MTAALAISQIGNDEKCIALWVNKPRKSQSNNTSAAYARFGQQFLETGIGIRLATYGQLADWVNGLVGTPDSRKTRISYLKSLFSFAVKIGHITANPALLIDTPATPDKLHEKTLTRAEINRMMDNTRSTRDMAIIRTLYFGALRISELCALQWQDVIDLPNGKALLVINGKGGKSRKADIDAKTRDLLEYIRTDSPYLFISATGQPMDRTVVYRMVKRLAARCGIAKPVSPHMFRHSHASHVLAMGGNPVAVQEKLGHASLATTTRYAHSEEGTADILTA